jgi:hypothetical protein
MHNINMGQLVILREYVDISHEMGAGCPKLIPIAGMAPANQPIIPCKTQAIRCLIAN